MNEKKEQIIIGDNAWEIYPGPILVLSGPGTGKTFQLAQRIKYLTKIQKIPPEKITVITFTREAAISMRKKISTPGENEYIELENRPERISTIHSMGNTILKENSKELGLSTNFKLINSEQLRELIMKDAALLVGKKEEDAEKVLLARKKAEEVPKELAETLETYKEILKVNNYIDYDDQIILACDLLNKKEELRKKYSNESSFLLVDEYQDINKWQFEFIKLISSENHAGLFVVGDDDQSIYSFRGGSPKYIRNFLSDFGDEAKIVKMKTSWRCPKNILTCANILIDKFNKGRLGKPEPKYERKDTGLVVRHNCPSDDFEAYIIASIIKNNAPEKSTFILVPNRLYIEKIRKALNKVRINVSFPFSNKGSGLEKLNFIKEWIDNQNDNFSTRLCLDSLIEANTTQIPSSRSTSPEKRKIRSENLLSLAKLWRIVISKKTPYFYALIEEAKRNAVFKDLVEKLKEVLQMKEKSVPEFLRSVSYLFHLWSKNDLFLQEITTISEILKNQSLITGEFEVKVLTMQNAKGLQANIVFIVGLEENNFPKNKTSQDLAEQSRLFFVSMTRAIDELHLFCSRTRSGGITLEPTSFNLKPSEFITCLPKELVEDRPYWPKKAKKRTRV